MTSDRIRRDYLHRARWRRATLDAFVASGVFADAVLESHKIVELVLKGALRFVGIEPPKRHNVRDLFAPLLASPRNGVL